MVMAVAVAVAARKWLAMSKACDYAAACYADFERWCDYAAAYYSDFERCGHSVWWQQGQFGLTSVVRFPWYRQNV